MVARVAFSTYRVCTYGEHDAAREEGAEVTGRAETRASGSPLSRRSFVSPPPSSRPSPLPTLSPACSCVSLATQLRGVLRTGDRPRVDVKRAIYLPPRSPLSSSVVVVRCPSQGRHSSGCHSRGTFVVAAARGIRETRCVAPGKTYPAVLQAVAGHALCLPSFASRVIYLDTCDRSIKSFRRGGENFIPTWQF